MFKQWCFCSLLFRLDLSVCDQSPKGDPSFTKDFINYYLASASSVERRPRRQGKYLDTQVSAEENYLAGARTGAQMKRAGAG
ncbi:hypothetical protein BJX63DRAFT_31439 [Aspergillus granulosus]|uniref:Uncharacterized protein n=1 Tax=Aspergillus granulosus TaxID=176169 RepID=A0ABR4HVU0_9EURO